MRTLAVVASLAIIGVSGATLAEAQPRYRYGYHGGGWGYHGYGYRGRGGYGGAVAAGVVGGLLLGGLAAAAAPPAYAYPAYPYGPGYGPYDGPGVYAPAYGVRSPYVPAPYYGPGPISPADPYAAPHEIRGGYRTVYVPGQGRVIVGPPAY